MVPAAPWLLLFVLAVPSGRSAAERPGAARGPLVQLSVLPRLLADADVVPIVEGFLRAGADVDVRVVRGPRVPKRCWNDDLCHLAFAAGAPLRFVSGRQAQLPVLTVEVHRTRSGRVHMYYRLILDPATRIRARGLVSSRPEHLAKRLRPTLAVLGRQLLHERPGRAPRAAASPSP